MDLLKQPTVVNNGMYVSGFVDSLDVLAEFYDRLGVEEGQHFAVRRSSQKKEREGKYLFNHCFITRPYKIELQFVIV